jgi:hypothetical protein
MQRELKAAFPPYGVYMWPKLGFCLLILAAAAFTSDIYGQTLYSYEDENGTRVFTNIPPVGRVQDLQVLSSAPPLPPKENKADTKSDLYHTIIQKYANKYQLDPHLIRSVIATESGFNARALSPKGARGLMQLMPATAARLGVTNIFDPDQNIGGGAKHLRFLLDTFNNNLTLTLAAYNAGEHLVQRLGRVPNYKETKEYIQSVTQHFGKTELGSQTQQHKSPHTYRYFDDTGVLHLTNIPPVR